MSAEIVHLNQDSPSNVVCSQTGLRFPLVHRRTGHLNRVDRTPDRDGNIGIYEGEFAVEYTLSPDPVTHFFSQSIRPIKFMDSHVDRGWLLVRHHRSRELACNYLDYDGDLIGCLPPGNVAQRVFEIEGQYYTLTHRPKLEDAPDRLVAYITKAPRNGFFGEEESNIYTVLASDGTQLHHDVLYPGD